jgi:UDP-glucose 4-epimerase
VSGGNVLLLGGGGFIGVALARKLAAEGRHVYVLAPNAPQVIPNVHFVQGSLDSPELLAKLLPHCSTVIHLASATTPGSSANHPIRELENLAPSLRLLEALQAYPEIHLIFFSSGGVLYGNPRRLPVQEDDAVAPLSYHGAGKAALEAFLHAFRMRGHAVTILRPSNAYGPGQVLKSGFGLVRTMLEHACHDTPFEVWGDGENVRDFIYIDDVAEACARFVALPQNNDDYNVGSGRGYSIKQVQRIVEQVTGTELKTVYHPGWGIDVRGIVLDISRLDACLSWRPQTGLEEGVRRTWDWLKPS